MICSLLILCRGLIGTIGSSARNSASATRRWRLQLDGTVDAADYVYWRKNVSGDQAMYKYLACQLRSLARTRQRFGRVLSGCLRPSAVGFRARTGNPGAVNLCSSESASAMSPHYRCDCAKNSSAFESCQKSTLLTGTLPAILVGKAASVAPWTQCQAAFG